MSNDEIVGKFSEATGHDETLEEFARRVLPPKLAPQDVVKFEAFLKGFHERPPPSIEERKTIAELINAIGNVHGYRVRNINADVTGRLSIREHNAIGQILVVGYNGKRSTTVGFLRSDIELIKAKYTLLKSAYGAKNSPDSPILQT